MTCRWLLAHVVARAVSRARASDGSRIDTSTAMMPITTSSSIRVNAGLYLHADLGPGPAEALHEGRERAAAAREADDGSREMHPNREPLRMSPLRCVPSPTYLLAQGPGQRRPDDTR